MGRRVAELRRERGLTQAELAKRLGLVVRHLQQIEGGDLNLTVRSLDRLAKCLEVSIADLFVLPRVLHAQAPPKRRGGTK